MIPQNSSKFNEFDPDKWIIESVSKKHLYVWPTEGSEIIDSKRTNVTVQYGKLGPDSKVKTTF